MRRIEYFILVVLEDNQASNTVGAMTLEEIIGTEEHFPYKKDTIYRNLNKMMPNGWIGKGVPEGRKSTYYITEIGRKVKEEAVK